MDINNTEKFIEKYLKDFQKKLMPDNSFYRKTKSAQGNALSINIPQTLSGFTLSTATGVTPNGLNLRAESNKVVTQIKFRTEGELVEDFTEYFTSQSMKADLLEEQNDFADTVIGNYAAYKFASTDSSTQLKTSGTATRPTSVVGSSATVKRITEEDMAKVRTLKAKSEVKGTWYALMDSDQIEDLFLIGNYTTADKNGMRSRLESGEFASIMGFNIFERNALLGANVVYGTATPDEDELKDVYGAVGTADAVAATDVAAAIFWCDKALYANIGYAKMNTQMEPVMYGGQIFNTEFTYGVEKARLNEAGVISLIEEIA